MNYKVHTVLRKGEDHPVFCEDFLSTTTQGRFFIGAIFDGCSSGEDSHFASSLFGKIFNHIVEEGGIFGGNIEEFSKSFVKKFVDKIISTKVDLRLQDVDLLATFLMLVYDSVNKEVYILNIGDGVFFVDGEWEEIKNERFKHSHPDNFKNMPDYIAYDVNEMILDKSYFDVWYEKSVGKRKFEDPKDFGICSDGLLTFTRTESVDPIDLLINDNNWSKNKIMLSKKVNVIKSKHSSTHRDDLSIIRIIHD